MNTSDLTKLIDELTRDWVYPAGRDGEPHCFFCDEWQRSDDADSHEPDCPYVKARALIDAQQQPKYGWQPVTMADATEAIVELQKRMNGPR